MLVKVTKRLKNRIQGTIDDGDIYGPKPWTAFPEDGTILPGDWNRDFTLEDSNAIRKAIGMV